MREKIYSRYKFLDGRLVGTAAATVVKKVIIDQAVSAPIILSIFYVGMMSKKITLFFFADSMPVPTQKKRFAIFKNSNSNKYSAAMSAMEGKQDVFEEMKAKFWPTFKVSRKKSRLIWKLLFIF